MKPIIFNTEMVEAILDGRKSVTRKIIQGLGNGWHVNKLLGDWALSEEPFIEENSLKWVLQTDVDDSRMFTTKLPYQVGDILYVRETWCYGSDTSEILFEPEPRAYDILYKVDNKYLDSDIVKWRPSIHMPVDAARTFLRVTDVRVERLQDITEEQAEKEGIDVCTGVYIGYADGIEIYSEHWNHRYGKSRNAWSDNPWVWVIEFERISKEVAYETNN